MPQPFPFIVSVGRSGTTLLRAMLERHPDLAIPPESYFPVSLAPRYGRAARLDAPAMLRDLNANPRFIAWGLDPSAADAAVLGAPSYADALRRLYAAYASAHGKTRYADKTPAFLIRIGLLSRLFPESVFIHLVRDGRDVATSLMDMPFGPSSLGQAAVLWHRWCERGTVAGEALGPGRFTVLRYEDLVSDPAGSLRRVCAFIGLDLREDMVEHRGSGMLLPEIESTHHASLQRPLITNIRDWRKDMSGRDAELFDAIAGTTLDRFGYARAGTPSAAAKARAVWETTAFDATRSTKMALRQLRARFRSDPGGS